MCPDPSIATGAQPVSGRIFAVRGQRVIVDSDLAALYGVPTKRLNEQVRRNPERFPSDFMFLLTSTEWDSLRSQFATLESGRGRHRKFLRSIYLVKAFVELRKTFAHHQELSRRLNDLEDNIERKLPMHDKAIADILSAIRNLMTPPKGTHRPIGFVIPKEK